MRKSINTLSVIVQESMKLNVFEKSIFVFCSKKRNTVKILYWDKNGFCLWTKKLESEKFIYPKTALDAKEIKEHELEWLLSGLDYTKAIKDLKYSKII
jgi:transposase